MSGKADGLSPVRVSRLKKRRRPKEGNDGIGGGGVCALQNLPASSKQCLHGRPRQSDAAIAANNARGMDSHCKENLLNGIPSFSDRTSVGGGRLAEHASNGQGGGGLDRQADPSDHSVEGEVEGESAMPSAKAKDKPTLAFMDLLEPFMLLPAIPSMLGIDLARCKSDLKRDLEQAFQYNTDHSGENQAVKFQHSTEGKRGVYHSLVGRIDPHSSFLCPGNTNEHSIAFPQYRKACIDATKDSAHNTFLAHLNLDRKTGHGVTIPLSWYQFPTPKTEMPSAEFNGGIISAKMNDKEQSAKNELPTQKVSTIEDERQKCMNENELEQTAKRQSSHKHNKGKKQTTSPARIIAHTSSQKYQGTIRIVSDRGATIRETFDIDESKYVVGKLHQGDERYFIEKKTLPPPAISLLDESDDEESDEEECVAVVRYKIALEPADCVSSQHKVRGDNIAESGWISDRGRLAEDSYLILKEM